MLYSTKQIHLKNVGLLRNDMQKYVNLFPYKTIRST